MADLDKPSPKISTGKPGRPTAKPLLLAEHEARRKRGEALDVKHEEGDALAEWLRVNHPDAPCTSSKTIANWLPTRAP